MQKDYPLREIDANTKLNNKINFIKKPPKELIFRGESFPRCHSN